MLIDVSRVLVGVPALNEEARIEACMLSILEGAPEMAEIDLVVADGGSWDRTKDIVNALKARFPKVRLIDNPDRLQSAAMNRIASIAEPHHQILVRCDAHAVYPPRYVLDAVRALYARDAASVVVPMDAIGDTQFQRASAWIVDTKLGSGGSAHRGGTRSGFVEHGHHSAVRLDWFRRIGGYDTSFAWNEDAEFDHRLRAAGGKIWLDASIRMDYMMRPTLWSLARQYRRYGLGRAMTLMKHRIRPRLRQIIPVVHFLALVVSVVGAFTASFWFLIYPALYVTLLLAVSAVGILVLRAPAGAWAGLAVGAMHLNWAAGFLGGAASALVGGRPPPPSSSQSFNRVG